MLEARPASLGSTPVIDSVIALADFRQGLQRMADRLVVMQDGEVRQVGTQQDLYERPRDRFVAAFVGRSSFIEGEIEAPGRFRSEGGLALVCNAATPGPATLALRPERLLIEAAPQPGVDNSLPGVVEFVSYLGATVDMHVRISAKERVVVQVPNRAGSLLVAKRIALVAGRVEDVPLHVVEEGLPRRRLDDRAQ
jgi:ABC-type Fe3+/spermidine/putrescine transport system ATPase subunit